MLSQCHDWSTCSTDESSFSESPFSESSPESISPGGTIRTPFKHFHISFRSVCQSNAQHCLVYSCPKISPILYNRSGQGKWRNLSAGMPYLEPSHASLSASISAWSKSYMTTQDMSAFERMFRPRMSPCTTPVACIHPTARAIASAWDRCMFSKAGSRKKLRA